MNACIGFGSASAFILQPIKIPTSQRPILIRNPRNLTLICRAESKPSNPSRRNDMGGNKPTRRNPRKSSYGSSRRSILKKSFTQEQVIFTKSVPEDPVVAIIGGGLSGLACALSLEKRGIRSTVFDTGLHGLGGRMATRAIDPQPLIFDHAAQFFTVGDSRFAELVNGWLEKGLVRQWQGPIGELEAGGCFVPLPSLSPRYIGVNGMRPLADSILSEKLELSSIWALLAAFEDPLPTPNSRISTAFEGAFVKGVDSVSWMANNTKKLFPSQSGGPHCWTFFSTAAYGKRNKVPQENIPNATAEKVIEGMLEGVEIALGLSKGSLTRPFYTRVQLWGAALPTNSPGIPCVFDPQGRAGICGDWLLGSSLEAAALSGMALANHISDYLQSGGSRPDEFAIGLHDAFQPIEGHDIGQFPGLEFKEQVAEFLSSKT
ncbi:PREDICTED: uncharacterized protein LOC104612410 isoform X2 [Nelumbo nucifera]|uniref:Uncharacterized protein LOC104612410 isoform X2 n=1 Tax=Nelumbo nucifera TaxID=4432 RepID=A0A1U8BDV0_NELNU|nr:PREDICTED: uncharacterized protein LOC104612410 isoform X2 [Nelumbo nucifera]